MLLQQLLFLAIIAATVGGANIIAQHAYQRAVASLAKGLHHADEAIELLEVALRLDPHGSQCAEYQQLLGSLYIHTHPEQAVSHLRAALHARGWGQAGLVANYVEALRGAGQLAAASTCAVVSTSPLWVSVCPSTHSLPPPPP